MRFRIITENKYLNRSRKAKQLTEIVPNFLTDKIPLFTEFLPFNRQF
ncbi:hypothetical protein ACFS5N_00315 [Mucilaginibacter ximonensis]|uniref:Uncharacterized protein n=1 Tax=Mucilaginibacter ximonensis TaxID=538021 RepID=A0ABW5Y7P0_9SPHI